MFKLFYQWLDIHLLRLFIHCKQDKQNLPISNIFIYAARGLDIGINQHTLVHGALDCLNFIVYKRWIFFKYLQTCPIRKANIINSTRTRVPELLILGHWPLVIPSFLPKQTDILHQGWCFFTGPILGFFCRERYIFYILYAFCIISEQWSSWLSFYWSLVRWFTWCITLDDGRSFGGHIGSTCQFYSKLIFFKWLNCTL